MREVIATTGNKISLGRRGENMATCVVFDISEWLKTYGEGTVQLIHQRNGDSAPYPCVVEQDGSTVRWCIAGADVDVAGRGLAELQYYVGDVLVKSATYTTATDRAMGSASEEAPEPHTAWVDAMLKAVMDSEQAAQEQAALSEDAREEAESARDEAESARDEARAEKDGAEKAKADAQSALTGVQTAIKNIPAGATPIVNDLTTGGAKMALSAEMGKKLNAEKLGLGGQIPANADLNDYTTGGLYYISAANAAVCANIPDASAGNLAVFRFDTTIYQRTIQIFTRVNVATPALWYRKGLDGGWGEWKQFATTDSTVSLLGGTKIADCSLNDCKTPGNYYGSFNNVTDGPVGASGSFYMFVRDQYNSGAYIEQEVTLGANFVRYQRRWNGSAWGAWFATGGKVSGSYTGNGSATARTIDVGGIGKFVAVYSNDAGTSPALIVTPLGAFGKNSSGVKALGYNDVRFADGVLTVASADNDVNANGKTYYYQVL